MNLMSFSGFFERQKYKASLKARLLDTRKRSNAFARSKINDAVQRIYVINLDRKPDRWQLVKKELRRVKDQMNDPLTKMTRRFSAIDARYFKELPSSQTLVPYYYLADQLAVEPNPLLQIDASSRSRRIEMTRQEIAVALSHIEVWKLIAASDIPYTLVLEDDVYFRRGFTRSMDEAWNFLLRQSSDKSPLDLLYVSFKETARRSQREKSREPAHRPSCGIWYASGYILSKRGAEKLLSLLPVRGPIDLWLNLQFEKINVFTTRRSIIEQRIDTPSSNAYSVLPVLSQVGAFAYEKPLLAQSRKLPGPIFVYGDAGSGLTPLATSLSMLGYTCCSDLLRLPQEELTRLMSAKKGQIFNAYVNIGSFDANTLTRIAKLYPNARFISTSDMVIAPTIPPAATLYLSSNHPDKWAALSTFLKQEYPAFPYPTIEDIGQRDFQYGHDEHDLRPYKDLRYDSSPWIITTDGWRGISVIGSPANQKTATKIVRYWKAGTALPSGTWKIRDDTFPSNLCLFTPENLEETTIATRLALKKEATTVRPFTSAAIVLRMGFPMRQMGRII